MKKQRTPASRRTVNVASRAAKAKAPPVAAREVDDDFLEEMSMIKRRPGADANRELPQIALMEFETVGKVRATLREHIAGGFADSSVLSDVMLGDDRIEGVLTTRVDALLGLRLEFEPADDSARAAELAERAEASFPKMLPESVIRELMFRGIFLGFAACENVWQRGDEWIPVHKVWHPRHVYYYWAAEPADRVFRAVTMDGQKDIVPDGSWCLYAPHGVERGWYRGKVRTLAIPWLARVYSTRDWGRYSEVHGLPTRVGIMPKGAKDEDKKRYLRELAALGSESVIAAPQGDDGNKFDLKLVEAVANTWEGFDRLIEHCNANIAINMLGQNLTTEVSGKTGSRAAAQVHDKVRGDILKADAKALSMYIREQILTPWAVYNFGPAAADLAPWPTWQTEPPENLTDKGTGLLAIAQAVQTFDAAASPVDQRALLEECGLPLLTEAEHAALQEEKAQKAVDSAAAMAEATGKLAGDDSKDQPPGGKDPKRATSRVATKRLAPHVRAQVWTDELADAARAGGAKAIDVDVRALLDVVDSATDLTDLRTRLVNTFRGMDPRAFAKVMEKALILAELSGRHAVLEEL